MAPACWVEARAGGSCYALANQTQEATRRQAGARLSVQDVRRADRGQPVRRLGAVLAGSLLGFVAGLAAHLVGFAFFPAIIWGEAALTYSDGKRPFWDRTDWWDAVPFVMALIGGLLALVVTRGHRRASNSTQQPTTAPSGARG